MKVRLILSIYLRFETLLRSLFLSTVIDFEQAIEDLPAKLPEKVAVLGPSIFLLTAPIRTDAKDLAVSVQKRFEQSALWVTLFVLRAQIVNIQLPVQLPTFCQRVMR